MIALEPPLAKPLELTPNGYYGAPRPKRNGVHQGLDFKARTGDLVLAAASGQVARYGTDKPVAEGGGGGGLYVILQHDGGYETGYMHLSDLFVQAGQKVVAGQVIAKAGSSGTEDGGAHLHFQVKAAGGVPVDPTAALLPQLGAQASNPVSDLLKAAGLALTAWRVARWIG